MPRALQTLGTWSRPTAVLERNRRRYGKRFTTHFLGAPKFVVLSDPEEIKQVLTAPPDVLHPGEGARILEPLLGSNSVILLDEAPHLEQRRLMLPAFHGERMRALEALMLQLTEREVESWPVGEPIELHSRLQRLTLEIVLRAVFGLERGARLDSLRDLLTQVLEFTESPLSLIPLPPRVERVVGAHGPFGRLEKLKLQVDELVYGLIEERRHEHETGISEERVDDDPSTDDSPTEKTGSATTPDGHGADVLSMLVGARREDDTPMSAEELRDELMTALVAGHETTASQLAWTFAELARAPRAQRRLADELDAGEDDSYLVATINESMRHRPVLPNAEPRLVKQEIEIAGVRYPPGVVLIVSAYLVHRDPAIYPQPHEFRPERFLESEGGKAPGTYTWLPFGGGRRRCLGASFAVQEMKVVIAAVVERFVLQPAGERERARRRSITLSPSGGARVVLSRREMAAERQEDAALAVA
jgi:cytochrome P450